MARELFGSGQYFTLSNGLGITATGVFWVVMRAWLNSIAAPQILFSLGVSGSTNNRRDLIWATSSGGQIQTRSINSAGTITLAATAYNFTNSWFDVVAEWGSTTARAVTVNNGTRATNATTSSLTIAPDLVTIGASPVFGTPLNGKVAWIGIFSGVPTADQRLAASRGIHPLLISPSTLIEAWDMMGLDTEPGYKGNSLTTVGSPDLVDSPRIYRPVGRSLVTPAGVEAPGGSFSLIADPGSYAITGSSADVIARHTLVGVPGSYDITGFSAGLNKTGALSIVADAGSYNIAGKVAGLIRRSSLVASPGSYSITGSPTSFETDRIIQTDVGTYTLTGIDASLDKGGSAARTTATPFLDW